MVQHVLDIKDLEQKQTKLGKQCERMEKSLNTKCGEDVKRLEKKHDEDIQNLTKKQDDMQGLEKKHKDDIIRLETKHRYDMQNLEKKLRDEMMKLISGKKFMACLYIYDLPVGKTGGQLSYVDAPGMWYVGGSRPEGGQVGRFSSWGTVVPKGFLAESAYFSSRR